MELPRIEDCEFYFPPIPNIVVCYKRGTEGDDAHPEGTGRTKDAAYTDLVFQYMLRKDEELETAIKASELRAERKLENKNRE